ncbi:MAG: 16S rRNA (adenine(1518)-N(6)/adenine(1519)-N(6))-dimethyltransferase RsmA [Gammaproteobacteria bacterium]
MNNRPRKRFGQNFLHDTYIIEQIVDAIAPQANDRIVEIGPGRGALTLPLLEHDVDLHAVEIDRDLAARWEQQISRWPKLKVLCADALEVTPEQLFDDQKPFRLVGNLPYNISTPLLFHFVNWRHRLTDLHLMLQKEVVDRMCAQPGNKTYGRLTVMLAPWFEVASLLHIGGDAFTPPPKVDSAFIRLTPHAQAPFPLPDHQAFRDVVAAGFAMRRKTLRNSLRTLLSTDDMIACDVDPTARPETLAPDAFGRLAVALSKQREQLS